MCFAGRKGTAKGSFQMDSDLTGWFPDSKPLPPLVPVLLTQGINHGICRNLPSVPLDAGGGRSRLHGLGRGSEGSLNSGTSGLIQVPMRAPRHCVYSCPRQQSALRMVKMSQPWPRKAWLNGFQTFSGRNGYERGECTPQGHNKALGSSVCKCSRFTFIIQDSILHKYTRSFLSSSYI